MKDTIQLFLQLQQIDSKVVEIRKSITSLPAHIEPAKKDLAMLEAMLAKESKQLEDSIRWRDEQDEFIRNETEALRKAKAKLQGSQNARDFGAANREVDNKRRMVAEREEEVLKLMEAIQKSQTDVENHQKDVVTLRAQLAEEEASIKEKIAVLEAEAKEASTGRSAIVEKVDPTLMKRYEKILAQRGFAIAPIRNGSCQGCHMAVPPQTINVAGRFESIETCPRCNRMIFPELEMEEIIAAANSEK